MAVYAGRFIAVQWADLRERAARLFGNSADGELDNLIKASNGLAGQGEVARAIDVYAQLFSNPEDRLLEEWEHHRAFVETPAWGVFNALAFAERFHWAELQRHRRADGWLRSSREAIVQLGHAVRLHYARRAMYRHFVPVVEALFAVQEAVKAENPFTSLGTFQAQYGKEAGHLARSAYQWLSGEHGNEGWNDLRRRFLACLDPLSIAGGEFHKIVELGINLIGRFADPSPIVLAASESLAGDPRRVAPIGMAGVLRDYHFRSSTDRSGPVTKVRFAVGYGRGFLRSGRRGGRSSPYGQSSETALTRLPPIWAFRQDGESLQFDPIAATVAGRRVNRGPMEMLIPGAPRNAESWRRRHADQFLARKLVFRREAAASDIDERFHGFVLRWAGLSVDVARQVTERMRDLNQVVDGMISELTVDDDLKLARGEASETLIRFWNDAHRLIPSSESFELRIAPGKEFGRFVDIQFLHGL